MVNGKGNGKNHSVFWSCFWALVVWSLVSGVGSLIASMYIGGRHGGCGCGGGRGRGRHERKMMYRDNYYDEEDDYY